MTVQPNKEKRRYKRYRVDTIHGNLIYSSEINIIDISLGGASLETTRRLSIDREYALKINFRGKIIELRGAIAWSILSRTERTRTGDTVAVYRAGMRFSRLLDEKARELLNFINENKTGTIHKGSLPVRFKVKDQQDANVAGATEYLLKQLSLAGMLIESDYEFPVESRFDFDICFPGRTVSVLGRVVNCVKHTTDGDSRFNVGIEFILLSDTDRAFMKVFLKDLEIEDKKRK